MLIFHYDYFNASNEKLAPIILRSFDSIVYVVSQRSGTDDQGSRNWLKRVLRWVAYGEGAYWVTDGLYNSMSIVGDKGVIAIDAPLCYTDKLPASIGAVAYM